MFKFLFAILTSVVLVFFLPNLNAEDSDKSDAESGEWVTDVEPGIKRYGKMPKFAKVGHSNSFDVSPDGQTIAFASGAVKFWDIEKEKVRETIGDAQTNFIEYSPDGMRLYSVGWGGQQHLAKVYNAITGEEELVIKQKSNEKPQEQEVSGEPGTLAAPVSSDFHPQGLAVSSEDDRIAIYSGQRVIVFDSQSGEQLADFKTDNYVQKYVFIKDGSQLLASNGTIYSPETGEKIGSLPKRIFGQWMQVVTVNPKNTNQVIGAQWNKGVIVFDLEEEEQTELEVDGGARHFTQLAVSGNGKLLAAASQTVNQLGKQTSKKVIYVWDLESGEIKNKLEHTYQHLAFLRFSSTGDFLYSKSHNEFGVTEWDLSKKFSKLDRKGHTSPIHQLRFDADGESVFTSSYDGGAIVFDLESGEPFKKLKVPQVNHVTSNRDGQYFVTASSYQKMAIYDCKNDRTKNVNVKSFRRPSVVTRFSRMLTGKQDGGNSYENYAISHVCVADDDEHIWLASRGQRHFRVERFTMPGGKSVERFKFKMEDYWDFPEQTDSNGSIVVGYSQLQWQPQTVAVSDNGELVAIVNDQKGVFVIDVQTGELVHDFGKIGGNYSSRLFFTKGGTNLLVYAKGVLKSFDARSGEQVGTAVKVGHEHGNLVVSMCNDSSRMAFMSHDKKMKVRVLDVNSMEEVFARTVKEHHNGIAISNDGRKLAVAKSNCQFEVWDLDAIEK